MRGVEETEFLGCSSLRLYAQTKQRERGEEEEEEYMLQTEGEIQWEKEMRTRTFPALAVLPCR